MSHSGKITKIHALVNENFQLIGVDLTGENIHDRKIALAGKKILADKAFFSEEIRKYIFQEKAFSCISESQMLSFDKE